MSAALTGQSQTAVISRGGSSSDNYPPIALRKLGASCVLPSWLRRPQEKQASDAEVAFSLAGRLYLSRTGWLLLSVPNAICRGAFDAMAEPGTELPLSDTTGQLNAHISVIHPDELSSVGLDPLRVSERGKQFHYTLGPVKTVVPHRWAGVERVWFIEVKSPELEQLRKSYGLSARPKDNQFEFHITFAVRKRGVFRPGDRVTKSVSGQAPLSGSRLLTRELLLSLRR